MKKEFVLAFNEVLEEKQLPREIVVEALESAMVSAYRKTVNASSAQLVEAKFNLDTGKVEIFAEKEVVEDVQDDRTEVLLATAKEYEAEAELGDLVVVETTPGDFGRVAAQTARQVIQQRIREAERQSQFEHFEGQVGEIINGIVQAMNPRVITIGLDRNAEGAMPKTQQIRGERFRVHDRVRALLMEVKMTPRGPQIILSRAHRNFLRRMLEDEVPEIYNGLVEIRSIAREPGYRSKVAVAALQPGIDPVGACVGVRGVRIQAIVRELHDEKIDVIEWDPEPSSFIARALSPSRVTGVYLDETKGTKTATVVVPEDQLSLAIGKDGQNARLAAKLTGWRIDIKSLVEAASETMFKLETEEYAEEREKVADMREQIDAILLKKQEGRPIAPEEYTLVGKFVSLVETGVESRRAAIREAQVALEEKARERVPVVAYELPLEDLELATRINTLLGEMGIKTIGALMLQVELDVDELLAINGMGPKAIEDVVQKLAEFEFPEPVVEEEVIEELETEVAGDAEETGEEVEEAVVAEETEEVVEAVVEEVVEEVDKTEAMVEAAMAAELPTEKPKVEPKAVVVEEEEASFEDLLQEFEPEGDKEAEKNKSKGKFLEYDPDADVTIVRRRRKRDEKTWDEWDEDDF